MDLIPNQTEAAAKNRRCSAQPLARKKMIEQEKSKFKLSWEFFALGVGFLVMGIVMIVQGISAQKNGAIIPATGKSGPMTGIESIITGVVATLAGLPFIAYEVYKMFKRKSDN